MEGGNVRNDDALEHDELLDDYGAMPADGPDLDSLSDDDDEDTLSDELIAKLEKEARYTGIQQLLRHPLLSKAEFYELAKKAQAGDLDARNEIVRCNQKLVFKLAMKRAHIMELEDLMMEGNFGLVRAIEKFDLTTGLSFSTYATWWVRQCIIRAAMDQSRTIRVPVHMYEKLRKYWTLKGRKKITGVAMTDQEIAEEMDISMEQLEKLSKISGDPLSLDEPISSGGEEGESDLSFVSRVFSDEDDLDADSSVVLQKPISKELSILMTRALTKRERAVICARFGIESNDAHTLEDVGSNMGVTRERIRQIEAVALRKLRRVAMWKSMTSSDFME